METLAPILSFSRFSADDMGTWHNLLLCSRRETRGRGQRDVRQGMTGDNEDTVLYCQGTTLIRWLSCLVAWHGTIHYYNKRQPRRVFSLSEAGKGNRLQQKVEVNP
jgi:hypothetical protein